MRLAGDEQHAQLVAHAVDRDDGAVVDRREFAVERRSFDLDDVRAGMRDRHADTDARAGAHVAALDHFAVAAHGDLRRRRRAAPWSSTRKAMVCDCPTMPKRGAVVSTTRRSRSFASAGDQRMQRRRKAERGGVRGHVMNAAVGDEDRAGDAIRRHVGQRRGSAENSRVPSVSPSAWPASTMRTSRPGMRPSRSTNAARTASVCLLRSPKSWLGLLSTTTTATRGHRLAVFARDRRIGERQHDQRQRDARAPARRGCGRAADQRARARAQRRTPPTPHRRERAARMRAEVQLFLLAQSFQQRRNVDLVGLVVAGQRVHHDVDAGAESKFALARLAPGPAAASADRPAASPRRRQDRST